MGNPFYRNQGAQGNFGSMMQQFMQFKQNFQGDPKDKVQELLRTGQMSQAQFDQLYSKATEIYNSGAFQNAKSGNPLAGFFGR